MSSSTEDRILQQDMPQALKRVEEAAKLLEEAAKISKIDPFSKVRQHFGGSSMSSLQNNPAPICVCRLPAPS